MPNFHKNLVVGGWVTLNIDQNIVFPEENDTCDEKTSTFLFSTYYRRHPKYILKSNIKLYNWWS